MKKDHREGPAKEFIKILLAQFVAEDLIHEGKVIFVDLKLSVEDSLIGNLAGLVVKLYQESDLRKAILSFLCWKFSV